MTDRQDNEKTWLEEKMEDPQFRAFFAQEQASLRFRDQFEDAMEKEGLTRIVFQFPWPAR